MKAAQKRGDRAAHHHVVKVGHDEVSVVQMNVDAHDRQEHAREPADGEHPQERQSVEHRRIEVDAALVHRGDPVEDLDRGRDGDQERDGAEDGARQYRLAAGEHVVAPDQKAQESDGQAADGDELITDQTLA